jgi:hypothetical protein
MLDGSTTSSASATAVAGTSTNVIGPASFFARLLRRALGAAAAAEDSRHRHHDSECALIPTSAAYSFAVSPLSFQRSTRFAHVSRDSRSISASGAKSYATERASSGTRFVERIRKSFRNFGAKDGLVSTHMQSLLEEKSGDLWAGASGGAYRFDGTAFVNVTRPMGP